MNVPPLFVAHAQSPELAGGPLKPGAPILDAVFLRQELALSLPKGWERSTLNRHFKTNELVGTINGPGPASATMQLDAKSEWNSSPSGQSESASAPPGRLSPAIYNPTQAEELEWTTRQRRSDSQPW